MYAATALVRASSRLALALVLLGGCAEDPQDPGVFIALGRDFEGFESWIAFDRGLDPVPPTHEGTSLIYVDALPEPGAVRFPVGTRIVRVEQLGDDRAAWEVHAMVKRGGGYNAGGALDWEFFGLVLDATPGAAWIEWRGEGPGDGDGYRPPDGGTELLGCNHCHASAIDNDSVLSPVLQLSAL